MLLQPSIEILKSLRLFGMVKALEEQMTNSQYKTMSFEDRIGFLVEREKTEQESRRTTARLRRAKLGQQAAYEDIDFRTNRGLDKNYLLKLSSCEWIKTHQNFLITGPTGAGKSYLACAIGNKACREGFSVIYQRAGRMFYELGIARGDGRFLKLIKSLGAADLLIIDDWGLEVLGMEQRRDFLEILEERNSKKSTLITSQFPMEEWHRLIGDPTIGDAILDRLVHNAHIFKFSTKGESMRKQMAKNKNLS